MEEKIIKYPRTRHIEGSKLQSGDEDLSQISFSTIKGKYIVIEEKVDGANVAISFNENNEILLQSRGHYLTGGYRERHYNLFKQWASVHSDMLFSILGTKYIMYGEWLYAKHSVYYDNLPHYFMEFDIYDKENKIFLDTNKRLELLKDKPIISVPILASGVFNTFEEVLKYLTNSKFISENHINNLKNEAVRLGLNPEDVLRQTDNSMLMEGLYIKVEDDGIVTDRMKYVRYGFTQTQMSDVSSFEWLNRTIIPNKLNKNINELF